MSSRRRFATPSQSLQHDRSPHRGLHESLQHDRSPHRGLHESLQHDRSPYRGLHESLQHDRNPYRGLHARRGRVGAASRVRPFKMLNHFLILSSDSRRTNLGCAGEADAVRHAGVCDFRDGPRLLCQPGSLGVLPGAHGRRLGPPHHAGGDVRVRHRLCILTTFFLSKSLLNVKGRVETPLPGASP
jgi:hypothetical protein